MYRLITILPVILAASCNYDTRVATFADGALDIAEAFCERRAQCGFQEPSVDECIRGNMQSLCERYDCEEELTSSDEDVFTSCVEALNLWQCGPFLPGVCYEALELR